MFKSFQAHQFAILRNERCPVQIKNRRRAFFYWLCVQILLKQPCKTDEIVVLCNGFDRLVQPGERFLHTEEVGGSSPSSITIENIGLDTTMKGVKTVFLLTLWSKQAGYPFCLYENSDGKRDTFKYASE